MHVERRRPTVGLRDDLRKQLAELRIELEKRVGDAEPDQLSAVTALQEKAAPLDKEAILQSVAKTQRAIVLYEGPMLGGISAAISSR